MRFVDVRIERMGGVFDLALTGMGPGLNVVCGPNEAGKTTLKELMGSLLFGRTRDAYPDGAWDGGAMVEMDDGRVVELSHSGKGVRPALDAPGLFAGVDASVYRKVFSLGLDDLDVKDMEGPGSLRSDLIASGMGVSELPRAIADVEKGMGRLFVSTRGRKQVIPSLRSDIRTLEDAARESSGFMDEHRRTIDGLSAAVEELAHLESMRASLDSEVRRDRSWVSERDSLSKLAGLSALVDGRSPDPNVPMGVIDALDRVSSAIAEREEGSREAELALEEARSALASLDPPPEHPMGAEALIEVRNDLAELRRTRAAAEDAASRASATSSALGVPVDGIRLDTMTVDAVRSSADRVRSARARLEAAEASDDPRRSWRVDGRAPIAIAAGSVVVGAALSVLGEIAGAIATIGIGLGSALIMRMGSSDGDHDGGRVPEARRGMTEAANSLSSALSRAGLPTVSHSGVEGCMSLANEAVRANAAAIAANGEAEGVATRLRERAHALGIDDWSSLEGRIGELEAQREDEGRERAIRERLESRVDESLGVVERSRRRLTLKRKEREDLLDGMTEPDLRRWVAEDSTLRGTIDEVRTLEAAIRSRIGDDGFERLGSELSSVGWAGIEERLGRNESALASSMASIDEVHERTGSLTERANGLESERRGAVGQLLESRRAELASAAREWAVHAVARHLLTTGMRRFEEERQPGMVRVASEHLSGMAPGSGLLLTADGRVEVTRDRRTTEGEWSSGLADQVYISLRLALASEYMDGHETLPILLDDVTCRCDPVRQSGIVSAIGRVSEVAQVVVFTCHPEIASMLSGIDGARLFDIGTERR